MTEMMAAGVPADLVPIFAEAEEQIKDYFGKVRPIPDKGRIEIDGMKFMWAQANGLAVAFRDTLSEIYGEKGAEQILYKFGKSLGANEARGFHKRFKITDPMKKLAHGPIYFAYSGWAFVEILPSSAPRPDEDYVLTYNHPGSFEAEALITSGVNANHPVCFINAGYSSGWCGESFALPLEAREVTCVAQGDAHCTFIMAHRNKILGRAEKMKRLLKKKKPEEITTQEIL